MSEQQKGVTEDKPGNDKQWQFLTFTLKIDQAVPQNPVPTLRNSVNNLVATSAALHNK